jgi:RND family efflux transporter MFP subunit
MFRFGIALCLCTFAAVASAATIEGFTEPYRKIDIAPAEPGTITNLSVKEGDRVEKGQILASLDSDVLAVSLQIASANMQSQSRLDSAIAERDLRKNRLDKLGALRARSHASQDEVDRARMELAVAEASVLAAKEQRVIDELEYKKTAAMIERRILRSPIDGLVVKLHKEEREYVAANAPTVVTTVQLDPLRIIFSVPTAQGTQLKPEQSVKLFFPETELRATGKVEFVSPVTDADSGTVRVKVLLENAKGQYRSGVRCALELNDTSAQLTEKRSDF